MVLVVSGGFFSSHEAINPAFIRPLLDRGYTVFAVVHGSQPRYTVPEIVADMNRAVRFIRHHAGDYGIDPDRIGVTGASAGGHLSLMLGTAGRRGRPEGQGPGRPRVEPGAGGGLLLPADRLPELRRSRARRCIHATDHGKPFRPAFDYRELDPETQPLGADHRRGRLREITRRHLADHPRHARTTRRR